jgi:hypothetical protein
MPDDDPQAAALPQVETGVEAEVEVAVAAVEATAILELPSDVPGEELVLRKDIDPRALVEALRYLQQRIPDAVHLSLREKQSLAHAANLDPAVIESGIRLGSAWDTMKSVLGRTAEEVRAELETARQWDEVDSVLMALRETVHSTNLRRKHRNGRFILQIYSIIGSSLRGRVAAGYEHLRPYYDEMKRAILAVRKKGSRKKTPPKE